MNITAELREKDEAAGSARRSHRKKAKRKPSASVQPSLLDRDWQRIVDRLQVLLERMAAASEGELLTDEQMRSFETLSAKVVTNLKDLQRKAVAGSYDLLPLPNADDA